MSRLQDNLDNSINEHETSNADKDIFAEDTLDNSLSTYLEQGIKDAGFDSAKEPKTKHKKKKNVKVKKPFKLNLGTLISIVAFVLSNIWIFLILFVVIMVVIVGGAVALRFDDVKLYNTTTQDSAQSTVPPRVIDGKYMFYFPVESKRTVLTSLMGYRNIAVYGYTKMHTGVDFSTMKQHPGDRVFAAAPGTVVAVKRFRNLPTYPNQNIKEGDWDRSMGQYVCIEHNIEGTLIYTWYDHFYRIDDKIQMGTQVDLNTVLGISGSTGNSSGAHLHFEIRLGTKFGQTVDPLKYIYCPDTTLKQWADVTHCFDYRFKD